MNFSDKLKKLRSDKNITQEELAKSIFVSRSLIARYESDDLYPTKENIEKLALYFKVDVKELIDDEQIIKMSLDSIKLSNNINKVISIIMVTICALFIILSFLPIFQTCSYIYPIPPGQTAPDYECHYISITLSTLAVGNPIALITIIILLINIVFLILSLSIKTHKQIVIFRTVGYSLFVFNLFMAFISFGYSMSILNGNLTSYSFY